MKGFLVLILPKMILVSILLFVCEGNLFAVSDKFKDTLIEGENVLIYRNHSHGNKYLVQLIDRKGKVHSVRSAILEIDSNLDQKILNYRFYDSLISDCANKSSAFQLQSDTFLIIHDPIFRSNNSVLDLKDSIYWLYFNALWNSANNSDLYSVFIEAQMDNYNCVLFFNNIGKGFFDMSEYAYKRGFWFVGFSGNGIYALKYINQMYYEPKEMMALKTLQK